MRTDKRTKQDLLAEIRKLRKLLLIDEGTGLFNFKKFEEDLKRYSELNKRHGINFDVVMFDVDNLKQYNDIYGHKKGNIIIKKTAQVIKNNIRKIDRAYRLSCGADEFFVIYSHHTENVERMIQRITKVLEKNKISVSYGYHKICNNVLDIIDKKMYAQKRQKRTK